MPETNTEQDFNPDGSLTIMGQKIPPKYVQSLLAFYEADHQLTPNERKILAEELSGARMLLVFSGMLTSAVALFAPSMWKHFKLQAELKVSGATLPKRPVFHRPFMSGLFATGAYFLTLYYTSKVVRDGKIEDLTRAQSDGLLGEETRESKKRQLDVWKALSPERLPLFAYYYQDTVIHPANIMVDPRQLAHKKPHEPSYIPPANGVKPESEQAASSSWSHVRQENGFFDAKKEDPKETEGSSVQDLSTSKHDTSSDSFYKDNSSSQDQETKPMSAWERIRKGSK